VLARALELSGLGFPLMGLQRLIDQFEARASQCLTADALRSLLDEVVRELGFDFFALLHHGSLRREGEHLVRLDTYPQGWVEELIGQALAADDPVHLASGRTAVGFEWARIDCLLPLTRRHRHIFERSRRHGIGEGYTVPANVPGEPPGSCSFAVRTGRRLPADRLLSAEQIGAHAFDAARRIAGYPARAAHKRLSPRELECLHLLALGKTDWEISRILAISEETAHQYVKSARAAYDAVSRTHLVVQALLDGTIGFADVAPDLFGGASARGGSFSR
jgi:LuxR family quorum-sensing system transcriptional regulator CciR